MAPDESTEIVLVRLDSRLASVESSLKRLEGSVQGLAHVDVRLYESEQRAQDRTVADLATAMATLKADLGKRIDDAEHSNRATLTLLIGAILTAVVGVLVRMALG
jgi:hypothetical protein